MASILHGLLRDVKRNGIGYVKSAVVAKQVKAYDPKVNVKYVEEDRTYILTYNK